MKATVIGAGLAGSEAAWQLAKRGIDVTLYEMKPQKMSPAHKSPLFAELVCSNSLRSDRLQNAVGLLKEEMRALDSLIMRAADHARVPAGGALAVDRETFSGYITEALRSNPHVTVIEEEITHIPEGPVIVATGPLTSDALAEDIAALPGMSTLHFFDAAAPIVMAESLNMDRVFRASRYGRGDDYLNCPMNKEEYDAFVEALLAAETAPVHGFEENMVFEGCMPVESMARRGHMVLAFGPMKPVGLPDPKTGKEAYARPGSLCRGPAAPGRRGGQHVQPGGLPDPAEIRGAEAGLRHDPRPGERGVRPLRRHAPQHLPAQSRLAGSYL